MADTNHDAEMEELLSSYVDGQLSPADRAYVETHLAECEACRRHLAGLYATVGMLRSLPPVTPPRSFKLEPSPAPRIPLVIVPHVRSWLQPVAWLAAIVVVGVVELATLSLWSDATSTELAWTIDEAGREQRHAPAAPYAVDTQALAAEAPPSAQTTESTFADSATVAAMAVTPSAASLGEVRTTPAMEPIAAAPAAGASAPSTTPLPEHDFQPSSGPFYLVGSALLIVLLGAAWLTAGKLRRAAFRFRRKNDRRD